MLNAAKEAKHQGMKVMTLTGFDADNPLRSLGDLNLWVDSSHYNTVEMAHHIWLLSMVDFIAERTDKRAWQQVWICNFTGCGAGHPIGPPIR